MTQNAERAAALSQLVGSPSASLTRSPSRWSPYVCPVVAHDAVKYANRTQPQHSIKTASGGAGKVKAGGRSRNLTAHHAKYPPETTARPTAPSTTFAAVRVTTPARRPWNARASGGTRTLPAAVGPNTPSTLTA